MRAHESDCALPERGIDLLRHDDIQSTQKDAAPNLGRFKLQTLLDEFADEYNHRRPHRSLPHQATPATLYSSMPKAQPSGSRDNDTHNRIRHDRIDDSGVVTLRINSRMHHIGIGRTHARTHVILLIQDHEARIVNATTGELIRELTINPEREYQPQKQRKLPNP